MMWMPFVRLFEQAKADKERPSFIVVKTQIGQGCPAKQGTAAAHGEPLGETEHSGDEEGL